MKNSYKIPLLLFLVCSFSAMGNNIHPPENGPIADVLEQMILEAEQIQTGYAQKNKVLYLELSDVREKLTASDNLKEQVRLLIRKDQLEQEIQSNELSKLSDISKIRYLKGLEIIKLLYGKTLALDHHFASISTFHEISKIANPNHYPEFVNLKDELTTNQDKRAGFHLTNLMNSNIYTSVVYSFVSMFANDKIPKAEKDKKLQEVECILDFTLRMHNDLNTIYFETSFLQESNKNLIEDLKQLFKNYTEPIGYDTDLENCRQNDEWDVIRKKLDAYVEEMDAAVKDETQNEKVREMRIDLEFPVDRLLQFIAQYNNFIDQGTEFYEKFKIMLDSYENEQQCSNKLPIAYKNLKEGIDIAIKKFNTAYRPVEINGSKMKQLLYGINTYE